MAGRKIDHLQQRILQKLGAILLLEAKDPRFQRVTVTNVDLAKDQSFAKVYYTCFQHEGDIESLTASLNRAAGYLSKSLGRTLKSRATPRLHFEFDPGFDYAVELDLALKRLPETPETDE